MIVMKWAGIDKVVMKYGGEDCWRAMATSMVSLIIRWVELRLDNRA